MRGGSGSLDRERAVVKWIELRCMKDVSRPIRRTHQEALVAASRDLRHARRPQNAFYDHPFRRYAAFFSAPVPK
jgi:hypothetical protein